MDQRIDYSKAMVETNSDPSLFVNQQRKTIFDGNVGLAYTGSAPDLGCFESAVTTREVVAGPETTVNTPLVAGLSVFPNPVKGKTMAHYVLPRVSRVELSLYDAKGALLAVLLNREQGAGSYTWPVGDNYFKAAGMYYLKLRTNDKTEMVPLVK
jgi:hypothetical protein